MLQLKTLTSTRSNASQNHVKTIKLCAMLLRTQACAQRRQQPRKQPPKRQPPRRPLRKQTRAKTSPAQATVHAPLASAHARMDTKGRNAALILMTAHTRVATAKVRALTGWTTTLVIAARDGQAKTATQTWMTVTATHAKTVGFAPMETTITNAIAVAVLTARTATTTLTIVCASMRIATMA